MNLSIDAILVPQGAEYQAVYRGIERAKYQQTRVISIPMGINHITEHLERQLFWQIKPQTVLIMGLCGSLSVRHHVGNPILYRSCNFAKQSLATDKSLTEVIGQKLSTSVSFANSLTSDRPICRVREKLRLAEIYHTSVVDMEGFAYLEELQKRGIAVAMLRVVSDDLTGNLPDLSQAIDGEGKLKTGRLAIAMLRHPLAAARLIRGSLIGLKALQQITTELFINR